MNTNMSIVAGTITEPLESLEIDESLICRYYARGVCRFGEFCRFVHTGLPSSSEENSISEQTQASVVNELAAKQLASERDIKTWIDAPVFVPRTKQQTANNEIESATSANFQKSYAQVVGASGGSDRNFIRNGGEAVSESRSSICPYEMCCPYGANCTYQHGELCDMCGSYCLHPSDRAQRKKHIAECIERHEKDMELSFAVARSQGKTCGICFDTIIEKNGRDNQRFGILPNCNHIFCLECIRKWRQAKQFENKIIRACPECRIPSDFVCPSAFWVDTKEEKDKLLDEYKSALWDKDCKYFKKGEGKCPFGNKCFYKHALANGNRVDVGVPKRRKVLRRDAEILDLFDIYLYDFVDRRNFDLQDLFNLDDVDDSDWTDSDFD